MSSQDWLLWRSRLSYWLPPAAWMGLIFYFSAQSELPHPQSGWVDLLISSGAHVLLFGVLAVLWARGLGAGPRAWLTAFALTTGYGLLDEFHQSFVPGRTPDVLDLICDALGALVGLWLWVRLQRHYSGNRSATR
jgi:VanZ family protein